MHFLVYPFIFISLIFAADEEKLQPFYKNKVYFYLSPFCLKPNLGPAQETNVAIFYGTN